MQLALELLAFLAAAVVVLHLIGRRLPREHRASRSARIRATPGAIFSTLIDVEALPRWRRELKSAERLTESSGRRRYRETTSQGDLTFEVTEEIPERRLVTTIVDEGQPFGGKWTIELRPVGDETEVTITEDGFVNPPIFRFLSRYVVGQTGAMEAYLRNLEKRMDTAPR